jgi:hypothetical protein
VPRSGEPGGAGYPPPTVARPPIAEMDPARRLALGAFAALVLVFFPLSQWNLWVQDGEGGPPGPAEVLRKYHGNREGSRLHRVLDPALPEDHDLNMYLHLGPPETREGRRAAILGWVEAGAPREGWEAVAPILTGAATCGACHSADGMKADLPFETYEQVLPFAAPDRGMRLGPLLVSAHNHLFAFAVMALLVSLAYTLTRVRGLLRVAPVLGAFGGALLDITSWFLTRELGAPFHLGVIAGGALFGASVGLMAFVVLLEALLARRAAAAPPA